MKPSPNRYFPGTVKWFIIAITLICAAQLKPLIAQHEHDFDNGTITVRVFDKDSDKPMPGVTVKIDNTLLGKTNMAGRFQFAGIPSGEHELAVSAKGFKEAIMDSIQILPGEEQVVLIPMESGTGDAVRVDTASIAEVVELEELLVSVDVLM